MSSHHTLRDFVAEDVIQKREVSSSHAWQTADCILRPGLKRGQSKDGLPTGLPEKLASCRPSPLSAHAMRVASAE